MTIGQVPAAEQVASSSKTSEPSETPTSTATTVATTEPTTTTTLPEPSAETDPEVLAEFVSRHNGEFQLDDVEVRVRNLEAGEDKDNIPAEAFVDPTQWRLFQILGLVAPDDDALAVGQHRVDTIRGFCCPVTMWDNDDHPLMRSSVLVHELTHLADDPRTLNDDVSEQDAVIADREPIELLFLPVEGNASRVQRLYEQELLAAGAKPERFLANWESPGIPDAMVRVWSFSYVEGAAFMQDLAERGGQEFVDMAFDRPPISSEQVFDVDAYLDEEFPLDVPAPERPADTELLEAELTLGSFVLALLADETLSADASRELVTSWAGDSAVLYATQDRWCAEAIIVMDDPAAARDLVSVLVASDIEAEIQPETDAESDTVGMTRCIPTPDSGR